ncbi:Uncharacterised protein [uncultured Avibacterium sp.]|uniref:Uncharacterized protein n=1 Tax=uncultured Avibacterium sp. TaxID=1936169 RepID=A0A486XES6_9PAST|nr:Uncharacterised protein [uncultured Avibacterium sp.]
MISLVLIPFVQGNVFRREVRTQARLEYVGLNPFRTGQCLSTADDDFFFLTQ